MKSLNRALFVLILLFSVAFFVSHRAEARRISRWYGPAFRVNHWRGGYWYHGAWGPRVGWWWVVGPTWYYYAEPIYPYPPTDVAPVYYTDVGSAPPPAPAPQTPAAPPAPTTPASAPKSKAFTYYCKSTNSYYPIASSCDSGWIATPVKGPN